MSIADLARRAAKLAVDNSPNILTVVGAVGTVTTAYLAGKASFQAADIIRLKEASDANRGVTLGTPKEVMKDRIELVWKLYIPPFVMGAATLTAIIGANRVSAGRAAGIATAYGLLEKNFSDHKAKVVEKLGDRKAGAIHDEIAQDRVNETFQDDTPILGLLSKGEVCYDMYGGQYFYSTVEDLKRCENLINKKILSYDYATLADFYRLLEIHPPEFSEGIGWNPGHLVELRLSSTLIHESKPCITFDFMNDPIPEYGRFH